MCTVPVCSSTETSSVPVSAGAHPSDEKRGSRQREEGEQGEVSPRGDDDRHEDAADDEGDEEQPGPAVAEAHDERVLAGLRIRRDVAQVVHHQERGRERREGHRRREGDRRDLPRDDVRRPDGRDEPEEHEVEQLSVPGVAVRAGSPRVQPGGGDRRRADEDQPRRHDDGEHETRGRAETEGRDRRGAHGSRAGEPRGDETGRPDAPRVGSAHAVRVVVGEVGADLNRQRDDERQRGVPDHDMTRRTGHPDAHGDGGERRGKRPGSGRREPVGCPRHASRRLLEGSGAITAGAGSDGSPADGARRRRSGPPAPPRSCRRASSRPRRAAEHRRGRPRRR